MSVAISRDEFNDVVNHLVNVTDRNIEKVDKKVEQLDKRVSDNRLSIDVRF